MLIATRFLWSDGVLHRDLAVETDGASISALRPLAGAQPDLAVDYLMPALSDLQVNGGGGVMLNSDPTPDGLRAMAAAHQRLGTGAILPTVITDYPEVTEAAAEAALATQGEPGLLGLHIEGPHIALSRKGTHDPARIRPLDERTVALVERLRAAQLPVKITLAPELADPTLLSRLVASGAVVSAGHSAATAAEANAGFAAGIGCVTHLFNAMEPMLSRAPGLLAATINAPVYAGIICDGIHVDYEMIKLALKARPRRGLTFAVSDAMATVGGPDHFELYGQIISVKDGALVNANGNLAGAHIDMVTSLRNLVTKVGIDPAEAIAMCTDVPRAVLGLPRQKIAAGTALSDLVGFDAHWQRMPLAL